MEEESPDATLLARLAKSESPEVLDRLVDVLAATPIEPDVPLRDVVETFRMVAENPRCFVDGEFYKKVLDAKKPLEDAYSRILSSLIRAGYA